MSIQLSLFSDTVHKPPLVDLITRRLNYPHKLFLKINESVSTFIEFNEFITSGTGTRHS